MFSFGFNTHELIPWPKRIYDIRVNFRWRHCCWNNCSVLRVHSANNTFKKDIVNVSFKDPYSFELLSLTYRMETNRSILEYEITLDSLSQNYSFLSKKQKNEKFKNMNSNIEKLNKMSVEEKNVILYYFVILECRGSNSFGNLVYSKYLGYYY